MFQCAGGLLESPVRAMHGTRVTMHNSYFLKLVKWLSSFVPRTERIMMWLWMPERAGSQIEGDSPLGKLSLSINELTYFSRGKRSLPPFLPSCFTSPHRGGGQHFGSASLSSQKGTVEENLFIPICPRFLVGSWFKKNCASQCQWTQHSTRVDTWNHNKLTLKQQKCIWAGALMGWPLTLESVFCRNYQWIKFCDGDLSHHSAMMRADMGKRSMLIITLTQYGWMRSVTQCGSDPIIDFSN